jgi:hypothetical protein
MQILHQERRDKISIERERSFTTSGGLGGRFPSSLPGLVILLLFLIAPTVATEPTVMITGYEVTPAVLMPGDTGTVTFTLTHTAEISSETEQSGIFPSGIITSVKTTGVNVFIENVHLEGNGIVVLTDDFDRLGEIGPGQSVPVTFVIRAPDKTGLYFPEAWVDVKDGRSTRYPITVNVNTDLSTQKKPSLSISRSLPGGVAPGEPCEVEIKVENTGLMRASDIWLTAIPVGDSLALTSPGRSYLKHLDPGEHSSITLWFATDRNTPIGLNPVRLVLTYRNLDGTTESQTDTIAIPVRGLADIAISSITTDPVRPNPGSAFTLVVRVENTGTDRATSVRATLDSPFPGTKDAFIGSIEKDSDAPAVFYLQATEDGTVPANLTISYKDDFGSHTIREQATLMTSPASALPLAIGLVLLACIGVGAAYWYFRIRPGTKHG